MCGGVGLGEQEDNGLRFGNWWSHRMGSTSGHLVGFFGGDSFYLLAGGGNSKAG